MQKAMQGKDFKMIRRNSLTAEVDGVWANLEEEEDSYTPHKVMMKGKCMGEEGREGGKKREACKCLSARKEDGLRSCL